jgi:hypothetical protein
MAKTPPRRAAEAPRPRPMSRPALVATGAVLDAAWGTVMWAIVALTGDGRGAGGWAYVSFSLACLGAGVAGFYGLTGARRRGERVGPRLSFLRRGRGG